MPLDFDEQRENNIVIRMEIFGQNYPPATIISKNDGKSVERIEQLLDAGLH